MAATKDQNGGFILIVEDDDGTRELETQRLAPLGLEIRRAATAEETTAILKAGTPELMLLDYSLAGGTAMELLKRLAAAAITIPPFLVVTGRGDEAVAIESMKSGALDYIIKNADFLENLLPAAKKALEKTRLLKELEESRKSTARNLRLYNFLAHINRAAAREKDRMKLLQQICDIAVSTGGMRMAWAGFPDTDIDRILPRCSAGAVNGYLDAIRVSLAAGDPNAKGPVGAAAASGRIVTSPDISTDPVMAPWREKALERGYRSMAAIPLEDGGRIFSLLALYSEEAFFFTGEELKLLNEIKGDISLALTAISAEEKRAAAQSALIRTADQLTHVMEANPVILFSMREIGGRLVTQWVSGNAQALTGHETAEILAPGWFAKNVHPEDKARVLSKEKDFLVKRTMSDDYRVKKKGNGYIWVHAQLKAVPERPGEAIGSWTDITPLKESEMRFHELFDKAPVGYQSLDAAGKLLEVNETWTSICGYPREEAMGHSFSDFLMPEEKEIFAGNFEKFKAAGETKGVEFQVRRKDGDSRRIVFNGRIAHNPDGSFKATHCVFTDITDNWKARHQMDLLNQAIKASFNEIFLFDAATFKFVFVNNGAIKNLGYAQEELEGLTPWDIKKEFDEASFRAKAEPLRQGGQAALTFESEHTRKDGTSYPVEVHLQYIKSGSPVFLAVVNDITEKKRAERMMQELASMQRIEALGALAGGIAHDFNNMLTGITANLSLLVAKPGCDPDSREIISDTMEAARNAQGLTTQLLAFSKGGRPVKKEFCLEKALKEIFKLATSGTKASCELRVPGNLWSVEGDENQIKQAVNNLLINAIQAMPSGGKLLLLAENFRCPGNTAFAGGDCVRITVSDTGIGIPAKYLDRIFEPYFTTKDQGHGLGLSMTWSVIKNHGGHIEAGSEPGKGTAFDLYLPSTGRCLLEQKTSQVEIPAGSGRVLVLEDEEIVSKAIVRMLRQLGYTSELTADGNETVRAYIEAKEAGRPFDIVIMDLTIPGGLGGKEAVQELRQVAPSVPVIVSSGYSDEAVMANYKDYGFNAVLPKPYKYEDLAETLARLLKK